jgi:ACS family glucarate transporter-like MFS transporter
MLSATATASYICRVNVSAAGLLLMREFHLSKDSLGLIFSAFLLGYALFQVPGGAFADRWGTRKVLTFAAWLWVVFTVIQAFIGWGPFPVTASVAVITFMSSRFLLGISEAPTYPGSAQGVSRWILPQFQGRANGIVIASVGIGSALSLVIVSSVMNSWGWRAALLVSALPAFIIALIWHRIKEPALAAEIELTKEKKPEKDTLRKADLKRLRNPSFYLLALSYSLQGYVGYIFVSWIYIYLVDIRHFSIMKGAMMSSLPWILSIVSIPLGGLISDRLALGRLGSVWGRRIVAMSGMGLSGVLISIGAHTSSAIIAAIMLAFATALVLCVEGPFWAMMMSIAGPRSGTAGGIMNTGCNIGGLISPALTPLLARYIGWENALHIAAVLAIIAALLWLWVKPPKEASKMESQGQCAEF